LEAPKVKDGVLGALLVELGVPNVKEGLGTNVGPGTVVDPLPIGVDVLLGIPKLKAGLSPDV
jgi:hypothetical protein